METHEQAANNRLVLLMIIGIPLTMILAATWLWYFVVRGDLDIVGMLGTAHRGTLVQPPRSLMPVTLRDDEGRPVDAKSLEHHWTMVVPVTGTACDSTCEHVLYETRQIHLAMGREFKRIQRALVSSHPPGEMQLAVTALSDERPLPADFSAYLADEHRGLRALQLAAGDINTLFPERLDEPSTWYLVDPAGWIMMTYDSDIHYKDVMADLKFLLKNSND